MNPMYCNICSDVKHASGNLYAIKNIVDNLTRLVDAPEKNESLGKIVLDVPHNDVHNHFMCGQCMRFNSSEMKRMNNAVRERVIWTCFHIQKQNIDKTSIRMIKENLSGYFPLYVNVICQYQAQYSKPESELLTIMHEEKIEKSEAE